MGVDNPEETGPYRARFLKFVDAKTRLPLPKVGVRTTYESGESSSSALISSDEDGRVALSREVMAGNVEIASEGWAFNSTLPALRRVYAAPAERKARFDFAEDNAPAFALRRVKQVRLQAGYADSIPYRGSVCVRCDSGTAVQFEFDGELVVWCDGDISQLSFSLSSARPGYADAASSLQLESFDNSVQVKLEETFPASGVIVADLGAFPDGVPVVWGVRRVVNSTESPAHFGKEAREPATRSTGLLAPGDFRVYAYQACDPAVQSRLQWRSEIVHLRAGETVTVVASPTASCGIRARLVATTGEAVCPGAIRMSSAIYLSWPLELKRNPGLSDGTAAENGFCRRSGEVQCAGLWAGAADLQAEAPGFEVVSRSVHLMPGQMLDLGVIVLSRATGAIEVVVTSEIASEDAEYELLLLQPGGLAVSDRLKFKGKYFRFEHLPLREYAISINDISEQTGDWSKNVRLTEEAPEIKVTFEMRRPPLPPRNK